MRLSLIHICSLDEFDRWLADLDPFSLADALADGDGRQILTPAQAERMLDGYHAARRWPPSASPCLLYTSHQESGQVIFIDQKEKMPTWLGANSQCKYHEFTKSREQGRYGLLTDVYDEE